MYSRQAGEERERQRQIHVPSLQFFRAKKSTADKLRLPLEMYSRATRNGFSGRPILPCSTVQLDALEGRGGKHRKIVMRSQPSLQRQSLLCSEVRYPILHGHQEMDPQTVLRAVTLRGTSEIPFSNSLETVAFPDSCKSLTSFCS